MQNSAAGWFGSPSLGQGFMGQNYGNRRRYSKNPYPVSQESVLPPDTLTKEQLEDWEAEHEMKAPPGSHELRPHPDFPRTTQETPKEVKSWVDTGLPSVTQNPIPTTPMTVPAPLPTSIPATPAGAPMTEATPIAPLPPDYSGMVEGEPVASGPSGQYSGEEEEALDLYSDAVDALCQIGERFNIPDTASADNRAQIDRGREGALSSVPENRRDTVESIAAKQCNDYANVAHWTDMRNEIESGRRRKTAPLRDPIADRVPSFHPGYTPRYDRLKRENIATPAVQVSPVQPPQPPQATPVNQSESTSMTPTPGGGGQNCPPGQFWDGTQCRGSVSSIPDVASLPASGGSPVASLPTGGGAPSAIPPAAEIPMGPVDVSNLPSMITGIRNPMTARVGEVYPVVNHV